MEILILLLILTTVSAIEENSTDTRFGRFPIYPQRISVDQTINKIIQNATSAAINMHQRCDEIEEQIKDITNDLLQQFNTDITSINEYATTIATYDFAPIIAGGQAAAVCIYMQQPRFATIINTALGESEDCIANKLTEGETIVNDLYAYGQQSAALAEAVARDLQACGGNLSGVLGAILNPAYYSCKIRVAANASAQYSTLGVQMTQKLDEAALYVATLKADLLMCGSLAGAQGLTRALSIVADIAACLASSA